MKKRSRPRSYKSLICGDMLAIIEFDSVKNLIDLCAVWTETSIPRWLLEFCSSSSLQYKWMGMKMLKTLTPLLA